MKILVVNSGSSSMKYQLIESDTGEVLAKGLADRIGLAASTFTHHLTGSKKRKWDFKMENHNVAVAQMIECLVGEDGPVDSLEEIAAVGHRVVHGGEEFSASVLVNDEVKASIVKSSVWSPLHNPANLSGIEVCEELMPGIPQVAVFDTAFHQTMPDEAYMYGLPYDAYETYGVRRYGFHGTSHRYVAQRVAAVLGKDLEDLKIVVCHLGNGSSMSAVMNGKCVDTSMGLTPLAGVMMGTRCGDIDPAIIPFMMEQKNISAHEVDRILNKESGVLGVSGVSSDFRDLAEAREQGNKRADLALRMFEYQVLKYVGSYAAAMAGIDAIAFTAGIGENTPFIRKNILDRLNFFGLEVDEEKNENAGDEEIITTPESKVHGLVISTNEELAIALDTADIVASL